MMDKTETTPRTPAQVELISCEVCLQEIPNTVNQNAEADEYVSNYCGLECYQQWRDLQSIETSKKAIE